MEKEMFKKYLDAAVKPLRCVCGREYSNMASPGDKYIGGFIKQDKLIIWCCSSRCADKSMDKVI